MFELSFNAQEIHLYSLLQFPSLLLASVPGNLTNTSENEKERLQFEKIAGNYLGMPVLEWLEGLQEALESRRDDISRFYTKSFSFPEALLDLVPLQSVDGDMGRWLEAAHNLSDADLRSALISAAWPSDRDLDLVFMTEEGDLAIKDQDELSSFLEARPEQRSAYLRQAGLTASDAWTLQSLIEDPKLALRAFAALIQSFQFVSEAVVGSRETEATNLIETKLDYIEDNLEGLYDFNPGLKSFLGKSNLSTKDSAIAIMPSLDPFACRQLHNSNQILLGFAIPLYFEAAEQWEEARREEHNAFCQSLADPTRYKLCCLLAQGPYKQKDLAEKLDVSQATISHHLTQLKDKGLVSEDRNGGLAVDSIKRYLQGVAEDLRIYG